MIGDFEFPQTEEKLLALLKHPDPEVRVFGWNCYFEKHLENLYRDARLSLLKRGMTDNIEEDTFALIREVWLKLLLHIDRFEYRDETGLYHYSRAYIAFEAFNLRRAKQRELRTLAMHVSLDEADDSGGELATSALHALISHSASSDSQNVVDTLDPTDDHLRDAERIAALLFQRLDDQDRSLLTERFVSRADYKALARRLGVTPNYARQIIFRSKRRFITAYKTLVAEEYEAGRIPYGTFRWLMTYVEDAA